MLNTKAFQMKDNIRRNKNDLKWLRRSCCSDTKQKAERIFFYILFPHTLKSNSNSNSQRMVYCVCYFCWIPVETFLIHMVFFFFFSPATRRERGFARDRGVPGADVRVHLPVSNPWPPNSSTVQGWKGAAHHPAGPSLQHPGQVQWQHREGTDSVTSSCLRQRGVLQMLYNSF